MSLLNVNKNEVEKVEYIVLNDDNVKDVNATEDDTIEFYLEMLGANYHLAPFVGFSLKINDKIYVSRDVELLEEDNIKHILEDEKIKKNVFDLKRTMVAAHRLGIHTHGLDYDMLLASYLINNENNSNDLGEIAHLYGDYSVKTDLEVYGKGKK